jgi:hypothetical protein
MISSNNFKTQDMFPQPGTLSKEDLPGWQKNKGSWEIDRPERHW